MSVWIWSNGTHLLCTILTLRACFTYLKFWVWLCVLLWAFYFCSPTPSSLNGSRVCIISWKMLFLIRELCREAQLPSLCSLGLACDKIQQQIHKCLHGCTCKIVSSLSSLHLIIHQLTWLLQLTCLLYAAQTTFNRIWDWNMTCSRCRTHRQLVLIICIYLKENTQQKH